MDFKRADVVDVKCHYRKNGALYRIAELSRATGNIIVEQKSRPSGDGKDVSWTTDVRLGKVAQGDML